MFSFASKLVRSIEHSAETIIGGDDRSAASLANDAYFTYAQGATHGLRVLSVKSDSLAQTAGLESWFDYIIGINGQEIPTNYTQQHQLIPNYEYFIKSVAQSSTGNVEFLVWSAKGGTTKTVTLPIDPIGDSLQEVPLTPQPNLLQQQLFKTLGIALQWTPLITATFVYHVLQIHPNSPAERAGLIEHSDYIIAAQDGLLATGGEDLLGRLIASKKNQPLELYVYNQDYDVVRPVTIIPVDTWGGTGLLGAGVGYGFLHRIPVPSSTEPGAVLFDGNDQTQQQPTFQQQVQQQAETELQGTYVPAPLENFAPNIPPPSTTFKPATAPPIHGRKKKATHLAKSDMLDYLASEGEKSRKLDNQGRSHDADTSLPPPPKM